MIFLVLCFFFITNAFIYSEAIPEYAFSSSARGSTVLNILRMAVAPQFMAKGESGTADITSNNIFLNPASVTNIIYKNAYYLDFQKINVDAVRSNFYYLNMDADNTVKGFYISYIDYGNFTKTDENGNIVGSFSPSDYILNFHYSLGKKDRIGFNFKYVYSDMVYSNINAFLFDFGFNLSAKRARYAFTVRNLGFIKNHIPPLEIDIGIKYSYSNKLSGFFDYKIPSSNSAYPCGGFEYIFANYDDVRLKLRGGVNFKNKPYLGWGSIVSGGIGFEIGSFFLDYAFVPYSSIDYTHFLSIRFLYGSPNKEKINKEKFADFLMKQIALKKRISILGFIGQDYEYGKVISNSLEEMLLSQNYTIITSLDPIYLNAVKSVPLDKNEAILIAKKLKLDYAIFGKYERLSDDMVKIIMNLLDFHANTIKEFEMNANIYDIRNIVLKLSYEISKNIK